jgi:hypothetical protein
MPANKLKQLLGKGPLVADNLRDALAICDDWYAAEPSLATFVIRSLVRDLERRGWDDQQGVPAVQYAPFKSTVEPQLIGIVDILAVTPAAEPITELDALVVAYRDSIKATP